jgi:hypothetical protein
MPAKTSRSTKRSKPAPNPQHRPLLAQVIPSSTVPTQTITVLGLCEMLSIGQTMAWRLIRSGQVKSLRIGRRVLITIDSVQDLIERKSAEALPPKRTRPGTLRAAVAE